MLSVRMNFPTRFYGALAAVLLVPSDAARAQDTVWQTPPRLEARVDSIFSGTVSATSPGCAVAVMRNGAVILTKAYGMANISLNVPMTSAVSTWIPYSEARVFVALAVAMLARDGRISLDDPIQSHVPEVPSYAAEVRVRQLIHHTSGLPDYGVLAGPGWTLSDRMSEDEFLRIINRWGRLGFEPGTDMMYSNTDYALLKIMVERVSGGSLHAYLDGQLFQKLGMRSTRIGADQAAVFPNHALFHEEADSGHRALLGYRTSPVGGISVTTSVDDLVRWENALRDSTLGLDNLLEPLRAGAPTPDEGFAFGIYGLDRGGVQLEVHRGVGEYMYLTRAPAGISVAIICTAYERMWEFGPAVAGLFLRTPAPLLTADAAPAAVPPLATVTMSPAALQRFAGVFRPADGGDPTFRMAVVGDVLQFTAPDGSTFDTRPVGDGTFEFTHPSLALLHLVFAGGDTTMTLATLNAATGEPQAPVLERWVPVRPTAAMLRSYPGVYLGVDVDVTLYVTVSGERVLMAGRGLAANALEPARVPDKFDLSLWASGYDVTFHRDSAGDVTHLTLDATRVKGLRFTRADEQ
jgi:CubicO group peptidase (beta-lactamase class C family)